MNIAAAGLLGLAAGSLRADAAPATPKWYDTMKFDGFVEGSYKYNPTQSNISLMKGAGAQSVDHVYDLQQNTFALDGGRIGMKSADGFAVVDMYFGDYATVLAGGTVTPGKVTTIQIGQALINEAFGPVTFTLGRYMTHVGYEVIDSVGNANFTRSLLYNQEPIYHEGLKAAYTMADGLGFMAQVDDGNSITTSQDASTAGGAQISYTGMKGLALYLNYYFSPVNTGFNQGGGASGVTNTTWNDQHFINFVGTYTISDSLSVGAEYLYSDVIPTLAFVAFPNPAGIEMQGYALYGSYTIPGMGGLSVNPRFEALYQPTPGAFPGPYGLPEAQFDYSLDLKYAKGQVTNWLEFREDAANRDGIYGVDNAGKALDSEMALTYGLTYGY